LCARPRGHHATCRARTPSRERERHPSHARQLPGAGSARGSVLGPLHSQKRSLSLSPPSPLFSQADPPDAAKLPPGDVVGVTALLLTCSYQAKEFLRVGYYVNVEYADEALREAPPERPVVER